jgi:heat shock protein HslJ
MACPDGLEVEQALLQALAATARYRLHRNRLDLRDAAGRLLAHWIAAPGG